jgi:hypothetical protein
MEQKTYQFPARREEIAACNDATQLKEWQNEFERIFAMMDYDYCGIENVPEYMSGFVHSNECNLKTIRYKLHKLTSKVTSAGALKAFHDEVKRLMPNEYGYLVEQTKKSLGKEDYDWDELIKFKKR